MKRRKKAGLNFLSVSILFILSVPARAEVTGIAIEPPQPSALDEIIVHVQGEFPDSCYEVKDSTVEILEFVILIEITWVNSGGVCLPAVTPYRVDRKLGQLPPGIYRVKASDGMGDLAIDFTVTPGRRIVPGDVNMDGAFDISDPVFLLFSLFAGGPAPACGKLADPNGDSQVDLSDAVFLLGSLFLGGPFPGFHEECVRAENCVLEPWIVDCLGHWDCECGECRPRCDFTHCGDGVCDIALGETQASCSSDCTGKECRPVCAKIGTKSEGWYDSCTGELIEWAQCAECTAVCKLCGSKSEGWYDSSTGELILYADCDCE